MSPVGAAEGAATSGAVGNSVPHFQHAFVSLPFDIPQFGHFLSIAMLPGLKHILHLRYHELI